MLGVSLRIFLLSLFFIVQFGVVKADIVDDIVKEHNLDLSDRYGDYCKLTSEILKKLKKENGEKRMLGAQFRLTKDNFLIRKYLICMDGCRTIKRRKDLPYCSCETSNSIYLILSEDLQPIGVTPIIFDSYGRTDKYSEINSGYYEEIDTRRFDTASGYNGAKQQDMFLVFFSKNKPKIKDLSYIKSDGCYVEQLYIAN